MGEGLCRLLGVGCSRIIFSIIEAASESLGLPLFILARRLHKELRLREPAKPVEMTMNGGKVRSETLGVESQTFRDQDVGLQQLGQGF